MKKEHPYWSGYFATKNGSVYGKRGSVLSPIKHHTGYSVMTVRGRGKQKQLRIHRFVWECCVGPIPKDLVINHINGDKSDNSLENLELVSTQDNVIHAWDVLGRVSSNKGASHHNTKLTEQQAMQVIRLCGEGVSNKEIGGLYGLHPNYVSLIRHNKRWKHLPR